METIMETAVETAESFNPLAPSPEEIREQQARRGVPADVAEQQLIERAGLAATKIASVSPEQWAEVSEEVQRAQSALEQAQRKATERKELISSLESRIVEFGTLNRNIASFEAFAQDPDDLSKNAVAALWDQVLVPSTLNESRFAAISQAVCRVVALKKAHSRKVAELKTQAHDMLSEIRSTAREHGINLDNLLSIMRHESAEIREGRVIRLEVARLFERGFLDEVVCSPRP